MSISRHFGIAPRRKGFDSRHASSGRFVVDLVQNLRRGELIPTPASRGKLVNRIILSVQDHRKTADGIVATAYLGDGYRTADELAAEGWSTEQFLLLGEAEYSPTDDGPGLWSDSLIASTKRTKAYRILEAVKQ